MTASDAFQRARQLQAARAEIAKLNRRLDIAAEEKHARSGQLERLQKQLKAVTLSREIATQGWVKAARQALSGDMRELSSRVDLCEMQPDIVQSDTALNPDTGE